MKSELPKAYTPADHEDTTYSRWEQSGFFNPDVCIEKGVCDAQAPSFSVVLPPPNVTGHLHMGHAAMLALEDIMVRHARMRGKRTLWLPGTDHAAIATQSKVESILYKEEGKTRYDLGRENFLARVEEFAQASHDTIVTQCRKMGASLDWSREAYTLDAQRSLAVRTAFTRMYDDGLIYQGARIVNWDPAMQTTVSDDEVEYREEKAPFYYLKYGPFTIGTARPETKFGDKYVVVHPEDERYAQYEHGEELTLEWINGPITATVIKDAAIDREFGTGVMTITPWHDAVDFDIAERHDLSKEQIIDSEGKLLSIAGEFAGMHIAQARPLIVEKLQSKGLIERIDEKYTHRIATNSRGGGVIEPQIKKQWFVNVTKEFERDGKTVTLKTLMQEAVRSGEVKIIPNNFEKIYFHWINNLRDWCISRQIWYGHRIPVWYRGEEIYCGVEAPTGEGWEQDPDTLDTWFSSGLWTFSTLGWPEQTSDLKVYHPTSVLETGYDILFFWVARMILMSTYLMNEVPFKTVYLHGLVRDEKGRKMSKSLGNVLDPLDLIPTYGTDAIRLALVIGSTPGNDVKIGEEKIANGRNFTNKLWNISRYVLSTIEGRGDDTDDYTLADTWILGKMRMLITEVTADLEAYRFSQAGERLREFTWNDFADWYLEVSKFETNSAKARVLATVLEDLLKLWHPFMPYVTETIWQAWGKEGFLMVAPWPTPDRYPQQPAETFSFETVKGIISSIRALRADYSIKPSDPIAVTLYAHSDAAALEGQVDLIKRLRTSVATLDIKPTGDKPAQAAYAVVDGVELFVPLEGLVDIAKEKARMESRSQELKRLVQAIEGKLDNPEFVRRAPKEIVQAEIDKLEAYRDEIKKLKEQVKHLN